MLPKKNRLERLEVEAIIKSGLFLHSPYFVFYTPKSRMKAAFAVTVSKKVAKNAVDRNRIRRMFYAALAQVSAEWPNGGVFMVKKGADHLTVDEIAAALSAVFKKVPTLVR